LDKTKTKFLLGKRKNAYMSGYYGLPGGRMELKESLWESVKRELKEETGLQAQQIKYLGVVRELQSTYNFIHFAFLCEKYAGEVTNTEPEKCEGWEWFELDEIPQQTLPGHLAGIDIFKDSTLSLRELL